MRIFHREPKCKVIGKWSASPIVTLHLLYSLDVPGIFNSFRCVGALFIHRPYGGHPREQVSAIANKTLHRGFSKKNCKNR